MLSYSKIFGGGLDVSLFCLKDHIAIESIFKTLGLELMITWI